MRWVLLLAIACARPVPAPYAGTWSIEADTMRCTMVLEPHPEGAARIAGSWNCGDHSGDVIGVCALDEGRYDMLLVFNAAKGATPFKMDAYVWMVGDSMSGDLNVSGQSGNDLELSAHKLNVE
jgi:hypothetical protein